MNEKQQQLTFDKGITNVPSDALCSDNALEESLGMVYENGEHRVIQKPKLTELSLGALEKLLYVHSYGGTDRYIYQSSTDVKWKFINGTATTMLSLGLNVFVNSVESIGNTLIVSTTEGLNYFLWDGENSNQTYKSLGSSLPDIKVLFSLYDGSINPQDVTHKESCGNTSGMLDGKVLHVFPNLETIVGPKIADGKYEDLKTALVGLVSMRLNEVKDAKRFAFPFWARSAIRLYDGSHTHISNPVLMMPTVRDNWNIFNCKAEDPTVPQIMKDDGAWNRFNYMPYSVKLRYTVVFPTGFDMSQWSDIISGIDIFVSEEVKSFDMEGTWTIQNCYNYQTEDTDAAHTEENPLFSSEAPLANACSPEYSDIARLPTVDPNDNTTWRTYFKPAAYTDNEIIKKLLDASVFYNIVEHDWSDLEDSPSYSYDADDKIMRGALNNLTTQPQLENDDYFSWAPIKSTVMKAYNSRLHLANISRGFFGGFTDFSFTKYPLISVSHSLKFYVYIKTESGNRVVLAERIGQIPEISDIWFYYPDTRAYKVDVFDVTNGNYLVASLPLKEHPRLHGAYYFTRFPTTGETQSQTSATLPDTNTDPELLEDQVAVSEVDNPYTFTAKGYVTIGMGEIIGLATQTMALDENEHGIHPLSVFSKKGISLLRLNNEGIYIRSDEISRESCNNPNSITETDGPVFFSSDKGLMVLAGQQVKCVSDQLLGKNNSFVLNNSGQIVDLGNFVKFLKSAIIAYDYRDSLLWMFDKTNTACWVYSIKSGTFGKYDFGTGKAVNNVVSNYPDYLLQNADGVFSLIDRPDINEDGTTVSNVFVHNRYSCTMITRPMKLENAMALKSIMQIRHIYDIPDLNKVGLTDPRLSLKIYASNNLNGDWAQLTSLRGKPWKYYRFRYDFTNLIATDRFAGSIIVTQERRTDKLR